MYMMHIMYIVYIMSVRMLMVYVYDVNTLLPHKLGVAPVNEWACGRQFMGGNKKYICYDRVFVILSHTFNITHSTFVYGFIT